MEQKTSFEICPHNSVSRRYDLDWLRVLVFGLLIFYHIGMLYVASWDFHIKSTYQSVVLENIMLLVNRWRMPLLFIISGVATRFLTNKLSFPEFIRLRSLRLLLPLLFGILVIVPPQLYLEMYSKGEINIDYWQFYTVFFDLDSPIFNNYQAGILPHIDVNHLWYLRELWLFTVGLLLLTPVLHHKFIDQTISSFGENLKWLGFLVIPLLPFLLLGIVSDGDSSESSRSLMYFVFFIYGYLLNWRESLWRPIKQYRKVFLLVAILSYGAVLYVYNQVDLSKDFELLAQSGLLILSYLSRWSWVLAILGYAARYLNKPSAKLDYFNKAVYPYYILHQTMIIIAAYNLSALELGPILEPIMVIVITIIGCALLYECIKRINILRPLFGLSWRQPLLASGSKISTAFNYTLIFLVYILVISLAILIVV